MKPFYAGWWLPGLLTLAVACSDSRSSDTPGVELEEHAGGHTSSPGSDGHIQGNGGHRHEHTQPADSVLLWAAAAANKVVISDQVSLPVHLTDTTIRVKGYGRVDWDRRRHRKVSTRTGGRVERLFVRYHNQYVHKGQKILELYTPEIATYAAEYLHHLQTPGDEELRALSRKKLALLGVTGGQLRALERTGHIPSRFAVYSPYSGYAQLESGNKMTASMTDPALSPGGAMDDGMGGGSSPSAVAFEGAAGDETLREGMYVNRGQTLFYLNDFAVAWGVLSFDGDAQAFLRPGMDVVIKSELLPLPLRSTIAFIEPAFDEGGQRFAQVRVYLSNGNRRFKVRSLLEGTIDIPLARKLIIPAASVLSLGQRKVVWVKTGVTPGGRNIFSARDVQVSLMANKIAVIRGGLFPGEEVAADAGYLLDNQSLVEP